MKTVNIHGSIRCNVHDTFRIYTKFKYGFGVENCCKFILPLQQRSAFAKFRCGVARFRTEAGRYENVEVNERRCPLCHTSIANEMHVILYCIIKDDVNNVNRKSLCTI